MADPDLSPPTPVTPLGFAEPQILRIGALGLREVTGRALVAIAVHQGAEAAVAEAVQRHFGLALPGSGGLARHGGMSVFSPARGQWFADLPMTAPAAEAAMIAAALGSAASVTDQTFGWARFAVEGPGLVRLFERLCPVDMAPGAAPSANRTTIEHVGAILIHGEGADAVTLLCARSYAASLWHALERAARSVA